MPKRADQDPTDSSLGSVAPADHPPIVFPDADWAWFVGRCAALAIPEADSKRALLEALYGHLVGVNKWLNLTTITGARDYLKLHVLDSLTLVGDARLRHLSEGAPCVDLGSGGGYPGLPLAMWFPAAPWSLVDARKKKAEFLQAACSLTGNPRAAGRHLRGGEVSNRVPDLWRKCQLVTCRAMGPANEVLREAADLVRPHGVVAIYKGPAFTGDERDQAVAVGGKLGYRLITERVVQLEDGDPQRVIAIFQRDR